MVPALRRQEAARRGVEIAQARILLRLSAYQLFLAPRDAG
jgi:hypothetical protein